jgi:hypothetical protein
MSAFLVRNILDKSRAYLTWELATWTFPWSMKFSSTRAHVSGWNLLLHLLFSHLPSVEQAQAMHRARFWDSTELVRISSKFVHFGEVRNEFYASHSENSPNWVRNSSEFFRNSSNSVGTEFFSKINLKTLAQSRSYYPLNNHRVLS